jgi:hypothetical protein
MPIAFLISDPQAAANLADAATGQRPPAASPVGVAVDVTDPRERFARLRYDYAKKGLLSESEMQELTALSQQLGVDPLVFDEDVKNIREYLASQARK